jgi:hypothetical protein
MDSSRLRIVKIAMIHFLPSKNAFIAIIISNAVRKSKELVPNRGTGMKKCAS